MTPKPQANRLEEIMAKHNGELGVTWENPDVVTPDTIEAIQALITKARITILEEVHVKIAQIPDLDLVDYQKVSKVIRKLKENK